LLLQETPNYQRRVGDLIARVPVTEGSVPLTEKRVLALTGTVEKYGTLLDLLTENGEFVAGILGCEIFAEAGKAVEPVTTDSITLIIGKQEGQKALLLQRLATDKEMLQRYKGEHLLLSSNDINTEVEGIPLTKSPLQKEFPLSPREYKKLITASLKFLAMRSAGVKLDFGWKEMQSSWELIEKCLREDWNGRVFLPIDYQTVDAFDLQQLIVNHVGHPKLEKRGPTVAIENRAYASLELDFRSGNALVGETVADYIDSNWLKPDFTPDRYPLGIKHNEFLRKFIQGGQHVLFSDHQIQDSVNLREWYQEDSQQIEAPLERMERMLNGFSAASIEIAKRMYATARKADARNLHVIKRKPGLRDHERVTRLPAWVT
jgi:hypothetical protein